MKFLIVFLLATSALAQVVVKGSVEAPGNVRVVSGVGGGVTPPPTPTDSTPILPQLWVNPIEYETTCATYDVTLQLGFGTNDYPATLAGLNSALAAWGADTDKCYHIQILHGTLIQTTTTSVNFPVKNAAYVKYVVVDSDTPLTPGQTVCSHGITDSTGPDPGVRNQGCNSPYNDIASMYTIEKANSGSTPAINIPPSAHHIVIMNAEIRVNIAVTGTVNQLLKIGANDATQTTVEQIPHHIHIARNYFHGYDPIDGAGPTGTHTVRFLNSNANYISVVDNYADRAHHDSGDTQVFLSVNANGPGLMAHNWFEGGAETVLWGGARAFIVAAEAVNWEIRRNRFTKNIQWKDLTGITGSGTVCSPAPCTQHWSIKNNFEIKAGSQFLIDGNIIENTWDKGQTALFVINGWGYGSTVIQNGSTKTWDIRLSNSILRFGNEMATTQTRQAGGSQGDEGTFTTGARRIRFDNLLSYGINKKSVYGDLGNVKARFAGGGGGGNTAFATASRTSNVTTFTITGWTDATVPYVGCLHCPPLITLGVAEGDPVKSFNCTDTSFNTLDNNTPSPPALAGSDATHLIVNNAGADGTTTGCIVSNGQGWGNGFTVDHVTAAWWENMRPWYSTLSGGFNRNVSYTNSIFAAAYTTPALGWSCAGRVSGAASTDFCLDVDTLTINHNVFEGLTAASYKEYPSLDQPPLTIKFPATVSCSGATADSTCVGYTGFMNGTTYPPADWYALDYHAFALHPTSTFYAGNSDDAADGSSLGVDYTRLDAALALNQYVCATACGTGPYPLVSATSPPSLTLTSVAPTFGAIASSVVLTGVTFGASQGASTVKFNGTTATCSSWANTSITCAVPSGATTGNVVVRVSSIDSNGVAYQVTPSISSLTPNTGAVSTSVVIAGLNFGTTQMTSTVKFNGVTATCSSWAQTSLTCTVPSSATTGSVVVNVSGHNSNGSTFTVTTATGLQVGSGQTYSTISACLTAATSGQICNVHTGTYTEQITGKAGVTVRNNGSDVITIQSSSSPLVNPASNQVYSCDAPGHCNYTYTGSGSGPRVFNHFHGSFPASNLDNVTLTNLTITVAGGTGDGFGIYLADCDHCTVTGSTVNISATTGTHDGMQFLYNSNLLLDENTIFGNASESTGKLEDGIVATGSNLTITGNVMHDGWSYDSHPDAIVIQGDGNRSGGPTDNVLIARNTISNFSQLIYIDAIHAAITNVLVENNVLFENGYLYGGASDKVNCAVFDGENQAGSATYPLQIGFYNNTLDCGQLHMYGSRLVTGSDIKIKNNIFHNLGFTGLYFPTNNGVTLDYNYYSAADSTPFNWGGTNRSLASFKTFTGQETNSAAGTALLNGDYSEQSGSPTRNIGVVLNSIFTTDILGVTRGASWDIGAFEF